MRKLIGLRKREFFALSANILAALFVRKRTVYYVLLRLSRQTVKFIILMAEKISIRGFALLFNVAKGGFS